MFSGRTLIAAALVAAVGVAAYAMARGLTGPRAHGFTIHAKQYAVAPDGTREEVAEQTVYVAANGDVREVVRHVSGEQTETLKLVADGAVYRVGQKKLHYVGKWGAPAHRAPREMQAQGFEPGRLLGYDVWWGTIKDGSRNAKAPALYNHYLFFQALDEGSGASLVIEAYAVDEGEPPAHLFRKPPMPESREWYEKMQAQRAGRRP